MANEQELNRKLAEWAGAPCPRYDFPPNFTHSLDTCFEWLVPKYITTNTNLIGRKVAYNYLFNEWERQITFVTNCSVEPSLALCLAIEKLIDQERIAKL